MDDNLSISPLSDLRILEEFKRGNIVIDPFKKENLKSASLDVSLGKYFYREQHPKIRSSFFNPYKREHVERIWKQDVAKPAKIIMREYEGSGSDWEGIGAGDLVILIEPGETILAHTEEFVGGRNGFLAMMKSRSSFARIFIDACKSAGWGDVGYINRWTMEVTNFSASYTISLVVGRTIAQMVFFYVGQTESEYHNTGKYQTFADIKKIKKVWKPENMLPKLWKEIKAR